MNKCTGLMGALFGHRFRPVITVGNPSLTSLSMHPHLAAHSARIINASKSETFHGCICQRCGAVTGDKK